MAIIISSSGKNAKKIEKSEFEQENYLQQYIYDNPESIPLYDINEDIRLLILCREFPTSSGPIDAIGIDADGNIYLIETKLYKNPDKRLVVAQVLDYGASLWKSYSFEEFINQINGILSKKFNTTLNQKIKDFFNIEEQEALNLIEKIRINLKNGNIKFVVLMDKLHSNLKDLIVYINQNSEFDIYAVELEYYKHEKFEIIIPKIYGSEVRKDFGELKTSWNWESFSKKLKEEFGEEEVRATKAILDWLEKNNIYYEWSSSKRGSFIICFYPKGKDSGGFYPFAVNGDGYIGWNSPHQGNHAPSPFDKVENRIELLQKLKAVKGAIVNIDKVDGFSGFKLPLGELSDEKVRKDFFSVLLWIKNAVEQSK